MHVVTWSVVRCSALFHGDKVWSVVVRSVYHWSLWYDVVVVQVLSERVDSDTRPSSSRLHRRSSTSADQRPLSILSTWSVCLSVHSVDSPRKSEGVCFYSRWFVCLSVCLSVTTITKQIGRICTKFYGKVPRGKGKTKFVFRYDQ